MATQKPNPLENEESLARRITYERERRHLNPGGLARLMTQAGCPMNQSAIWKIENGTPRRKITVDEALAFAKVFEMSLDQLLVPPELVTETHLLELLSKYEKHFDAAVSEQRVCNLFAAELEDLLDKHPEARAALGDALRKTFPESPEVDEVTKSMLWEDGVAIASPRTRWWTLFTMLHKGYRRMIEEVPRLWSDDEYEHLFGDNTKGDDDGEHQEEN